MILIKHINKLSQRLINKQGQHTMKRINVLKKVSK